VALGGPALAQTPAPRVALHASDQSIVYGRSVRLFGRIYSPPPGETRRGQRIRLVDQNDNVRARTTTDGEGRYSVRLDPARWTRYRAVWVVAGAPLATSDGVTVRVKPRLRASLGTVRLFDKAKISGRLKPAHPGARVRVRVTRYGNRVLSRRVHLRDGGTRFGMRFKVRKPGRYRARVTFDDADHLAAGDLTRRRKTRLPSLSRGSRGLHVRLLERRLRTLNYRIAGVNSSFDHRTADAVIAFNKVQGRSRVGYVTASTWRALASPRRPRPRFKRERYHFEIDQSKQVVYIVRRGKVRKILHTSTGAGGATRDGTFRVHRKLAGYSRNRLYYPSYFDGLRAFHGWPSVPTYPASHGCARVPMWTAKWLFRRVPMGAQVRVYH
jgi:L,D-transpeptidase catalytic domain